MGGEELPITRPGATRIIDFGAFGLLDEEQWKWIVRRRVTDWMINQIVYAAFRLTPKETALVEQEVGPC